MMDEYVFMSPIGKTRLYALDFFLESISRLQPAPSEVYFAVDSDIDPSVLSQLREVATDVLVIPAEDTPGMLSRISAAREALRTKFLESPFELSLWIDSDIVVPPAFPQELIELFHAKKPAVLVHCYPGRGEGRVWHGSGIMLIHKIGAEVGRFIVTSAKGMHISEDYNFFSIVSGAEPILQKYFGFRGVLKVCFEPDISHYLYPGQPPAKLPGTYQKPFDYWIAH